MDRFLKRKLTPTNDNDRGTSRDVRENIDARTSKRDADATNANNTVQRSSRISRREVYFSFCMIQRIEEKFQITLAKNYKMR
jgi:hypothetical protein